MNNDRIRAELTAIRKDSYAEEQLRLPDGAIDCTEGINPYGCADGVVKTTGLSPRIITNYPHHDLKSEICRYWGSFAHLDGDNIFLSDGSISALYTINSVFSKPGASVLGIAPQFAEYVSNVRLNGIKYNYVCLKSEENYGFNEQRFISEIRADTSMIYLDSPNNPTGQVIPAESIERILNTARKHGAYVVVDEAYGDFIPREESAIRLIEGHDNLIVIRTFSKGFGLAGMRVGYAVAPKDIIYILGQMSNPYTVSEIGRLAACAAMVDPMGPQQNAERIKLAKERIRGAIGRSLRMAATDDRVPIMMIFHKDGETDLHSLLAEKGLVTVDGSAFTSIDSSCVRLRIPKDKYLEELLHRLSLADVGSGA